MGLWSPAETGTHVYIFLLSHVRCSRSLAPFPRPTTISTFSTKQEMGRNGPFNLGLQSVGSLGKNIQEGKNDRKRVILGEASRGGMRGRAVPSSVYNYSAPFSIPDNPYYLLSWCLG